METTRSSRPEWSPDDRGPAARSMVVTRRLDGQRLILRILGEADVGSVLELRDGLRRALALALDEVWLDLSGLTFCDLAGLDALHDFIRDADRRGITTSVHGMSPVLSWLEETFPRSGDGPSLVDDRSPGPRAAGRAPAEASAPDDVTDVPALQTSGSPRPWPVR